MPLRLTVEYGGPSSFTPLYLTSDSGQFPATRRTDGLRDIGGDSWATVAMTNWLLGNTLRFDDISAANVKQARNFRSILGHAGHSDGQQVDVRYMDDQGGYSELLGGANFGQGILELALAARTEVTTNAASKPKLASLVSWITRNRTNINAFAAQADTRMIYIGIDFIEQLLILGVFPKLPDGSTLAVPGVGSWTTQSPKIKAVPGHSDHWHISKNLP